MIRIAALLLLAGFVLASPSAVTAATVTKAKARPVSIQPPDESAYPWLSETQYLADKKEAFKRASNRSVASLAELTNEMLSKDYQEFRKKFLSVSTPEALEALLAQADSEYDSYSKNDLKFLLAVLAPLRTYRGIIYRLTPLLNKAPASKGFVTAWLRWNVVAVQGHLPTEQWKAVTGYLTEPFAPQSAQIATEEDFEAFLYREVYPSLLTEAKRLRALNLQLPIVWDNQLLYGTASFQDDVDRFRIVGVNEQNALLSALHGELSLLSGMLAYRLTGFQSVSEQLGALFGVGGSLPGLDSSSARDRTRIIRRHGDFMTLRDPKWMKNAFLHLRESTRHAALAWNSIRDWRESPSFFLNPAAFQPWSRQVGLSLETAEAMVNGPTTIRSAITGETVTIDLPRFFAEPPKDFRDLLPVAFEDTPPSLTKTFASGKSVSYRNYLQGRPVGWSLQVYRQYFPGLSRNEDVVQAARILSQAWGGGLAGFSLATASY